MSRGSGMRAARVTELRQRRGQTQADLADQVGISRAALNRLERGRADPHLSTLRALAQSLGVPVGDLVDD